MIAWAERTLALDSQHLAAREHLAGAYWAMGDFDRHVEENIKHAAAYGVPAAELDPMKAVYASRGRSGIVRWLLDTRGASFPPVQLALFHAELGEMDAAIGHLHRAIDDRDPCLVDLAVAPQWDRLRPDSRFDECLARVGLSGIIRA